MGAAVLMFHLTMLCSVGFAARVRVHLSDAAKEKVVTFNQVGKRFEVVVPPDSVPGDVLRITVGCHDKKITVPAGATPGTVLEFDVEDKCCSATPMSDMRFNHEFIVPAGSKPGDVFKVCAKTSNGEDKEYMITVPEGGEPGMGLVFNTRTKRKPPPPAPRQPTAEETYESFKSMSLQELLGLRDDELAKTGDLTQFRLEMEIKKRIEQGEADEMAEAEIEDVMDILSEEEPSVDISGFFGSQKKKKVGHVTYLCCCQGHVVGESALKYMKCEVTPEKANGPFGKGGCGGTKGPTWHSFNNMGDKYKDHWYYDHCVVPENKPIQLVDFSSYPKCQDGACAPALL